MRANTQLGQSPVTYYFQEKSAESTLVAQLPYLLELARATDVDAVHPAVRHHARMLRMAIDDMVAAMGARFLRLHDLPTAAILSAIARDHVR